MNKHTSQNARLFIQGFSVIIFQQYYVSVPNWKLVLTDCKSYRH